MLIITQYQLTSLVQKPMRTQLNMEAAQIRRSYIMQLGQYRRSDSLIRLFYHVYINI